MGGEPEARYGYGSLIPQGSTFCASHIGSRPFALVAEVPQLQREKWMWRGSRRGTVADLGAQGASCFFRAWPTHSGLLGVLTPHPRADQLWTMRPLGDHGQMGLSTGPAGSSEATLHPLWGWLQDNSLTWGPCTESSPAWPPLGPGCSQRALGRYCPGKLAPRREGGSGGSRGVGLPDLSSGKVTNR